MPNIALMKLGHWHRSRGDEVFFTRETDRDLLEPAYDHVYGSCIFDFSKDKLDRFRSQWPEAITSGTGTAEDGGQTVEDMIGIPKEQGWAYEHYDYSIYPEIDYSIGFLSRGCRLACKFCGVNRKEGKIVSVNTVANLWRGKGHPKKLHLLDNDFFGNPQWRERIAEIRDGNFRICLSQGINVRLINEEAAEALATVEYRDTKFSKRCLYTAWDNIGDEAIFFKGVDMLTRAGIPTKHLMSYMLIGYDKNETWDRIWNRFFSMEKAGISPYPMVYDRSRKDLLAFQRWVVTGLYRIVPWNEYKRTTRTLESTEAFKRATAEA
jgi:hypothetical protein